MDLLIDWLILMDLLFDWLILNTDLLANCFIDYDSTDLLVN
jgi:hypothetical protein